MNKINNINIFPFLLNKETEKVLTMLDSPYCNLDVKTAKGNNLLTLAVYLGEFEVAEKLITFNTIEKTQFTYQFKENSNHLFYEMLTDKETFDKYSAFFKLHDINLDLNFLESINNIVSSGTTLFNEIKNIKKLKLLFKSSVEDIKKLDPFEVIQRVAKTNCPNLLDLYYDICDFNNLPIQEHPAFKLLADVSTNPTKYYDYYVLSQDEEIQSIDYNINKKALIKISNKLKKIKTSTDFYNYLNKNSTFLEDVSAIQKQSYCNEKKIYNLGFKNSKTPQIEVNHIYNSIEYINENCIVKKPDNFLHYYLSAWPTNYFKNKIHHKENNHNSDIKKTFDKYNFNTLFIAKDSDFSNIVSSINEAMKGIKTLFGLNNNIAGLGLNLTFKSLPSATGFYQAFHKNLTISNQMNNYETTSAIIHEYTHHMQFQDRFIKPLIEIDNSIKDWVDYPVHEFSKYLLKDLSKNNPENLINNNQKQWLKLIEKSISTCRNVKESLDFIEHESKSLFNSETSYQYFVDYNLKSEITSNLIDLYYISQERKDYAYDYYVWQKNDEYIKNASSDFSHIQDNYWVSSTEVHARLNQALYEEKTKQTYNEINPLKLEQMKKIILSYNKQFSELFKKNIEKNDVLKNIKNIKSQNASTLASKLKAY